MSLESKIKELEYKLSLKKAYLAATITFPKGSKIDQEVRDLVTNTLTGLAASLADDQELSLNNETLTNEEIAVLKKLAERVLKDKPETKPKEEELAIKVQPEAPSTLLEVVSNTVVSRGRLLMLDNIDKTVRGKVAPQAEVVIKKLDKDMAFVSTVNGINFWVPLEDLEIA